MSVQLLLASSSPRRKSILNLAKIDFVTYSPELDENAITSNLLQTYKGTCQSALARIVTGELAFNKALTALRATKAPLILASDTLVMCRGYILGKPKNKEMAKAMFNLLLGRELSTAENALLAEAKVCFEVEEHSYLGQYHQVSTSVCLLIHKDLLKQTNLLQDNLYELANLPDCYNEAKDYVKLAFVEQAGVYMQANSPLFDQIIDDYIASNACYDKAGAYAVQEQTACLIRKIDGDVYTIMGLPLHAILRKCGTLLPFRAKETPISSNKQTKIKEIKPLVTTNTRVVKPIDTAIKPTLESKLSSASFEPDLSLSKLINTNDNNQALVSSLQSKLRKINSSSSLATKAMPRFLQNNNQK